MLNRDRLRLALAGFEHFGSASRVAAALRQHGEAALSQAWEAIETSPRGAEILEDADALASRGFDACILGSSRYPARLAVLRRTPPVLFTWGNIELFDAQGVGMCGSRHASTQGLEAASVCGEEVARRGLAVISGYARGVDTETHLAALRSGGRTVIVLAEGISHFRQKRSFAAVGLDPERVLVVSQFHPSQSWNVGAAMTRNAVIVALGKALVVIEAGETGGTLNAGVQALEMSRPVLALQFANDTPTGNEFLFNKGAIPITSRQHLGRVLTGIEHANGAALTAEQLSLM